MSRRRSIKREPELRPGYCYPVMAQPDGFMGYRRVAGCLELIKPYCRRGTRIWVCEHDHTRDDGAHVYGPLADSLATFCAITEMKRRKAAA